MRRGLVGVVVALWLWVAAGAGAAPILYHSNTCSGPGSPLCNSDIWSLDPDTGKSTQLTSGPPGDSGARWSPDGTQIVFARTNGSENHGYPQLYLAAADGSNVHAFTHPADGESESQPAWSPLAARIAYSGGPGTPGGSIMTVGTDGAAPLQVTSGLPQLDINPLFTPDGTRLLFVRYLFGKPVPPALWSVSVAGGPAFQVTRGDINANFTGYDLSPDCHTIAFGSGNPELGSNGIYTLDFASGGLRQVTSGPDTSPVWSPDGRTLAFARTDAHGSEIFTVDASTPGAAPAQLTHEGRSPFPTSWAHSVLPGCRLKDLLAPVVELVGQTGEILGALPLPRHSAATGAAARRLTTRRSALHLLAFDPAGVRKVRVALVRAGSRRAPTYHVVRSARDWKRLVVHAQPARYSLRFLATDAKGNRTRRPLVARVTLRR